MAKKGEFARESVKNKIIEAFGENFVAFQDKKIYVNERDETGEMIQFAITMTMPKNPIASSNSNESNSGDMNWEDNANSSKPIQIPEEEKKLVAQLLEKLGLDED